MGEIARLWAVIGADVSGLTTGLASAKAMLTSAGSKIATTGALLTAGLTLPILAMGNAAVQAATDLDAEMRNIQSISKQSDESVQGLSQTFVAMSQDINQTRDSAVLLAQGFYQIQSSGFAGNDAMMVLAASTKAASAGLTTTETAVKGITSVLNAYSLSAGDAVRVSDVMFRAVDVGIFTFGELSNAIGDTLGSASAAKVPIEVVASALATMTKAGINVSEATTSMNQMLLSIIDPSNTAAEAAEALGLNFGAAHLAAVGFPAVLDEIRRATGGDIEALSKLFPNIRALRGILSLTRGDGQAFAEDLETIAGAAGATQKAFEIQNRSFQAQADSLKNKGMAILIEAGMVLVPILIDLAEAVTPLVGRLKELNPEWIKFGLLIGGALFLLGPLLTVIGSVTTVVGALVSPLGAAALAVGALGLAWQTNFLGIKDMSLQLIDIFNKSGGLADPINGIVGVLVSLGQSDVATQVVGIGVAFQNLAGAIQQSLPQIQGAAMMIWNTLVSSLQNAAPQIQANIGTSLQIIMQSVSANLNTIAQFWRDHGTTILTVLTFVGQMAVAIVTGMLTVITGIVAAGLQLMQGDWVGALNTIGFSLESFFNLILGVVGTNMDAFRVTWAGVWDLAVIIAKTAWTNTQTAIATKLMEITGELQGWIINTINWLRSQYDTFVTIGQQWFEGMTIGILMKVTQLKDAVVGSIMEVVGAARDALGIASPSTLAISDAVNWMKGLAIGFERGAPIAMSALKDATAGLGGTNVALGNTIAGAASGGEFRIVIDSPIMLDGVELGRLTFEGTQSEMRARGLKFAEVN